MNVEKGSLRAYLIDLISFEKMLQQISFRKLYLRFNYYGKGLEKYEELEVDECFGYLPRLAVNEKNKNLEKVKKREHIELFPN